MHRKSMNISSIETEIGLLKQMIAGKPRYPSILNKRLTALMRLDLDNIETDSIAQIDNELREIYDITNIEALVRDDELYHFHSLQLGFVSPRVRYLLDKRKHFVNKENLAKPSIQARLAAIPSDTPPHPVKAFFLKALHKAKAVYDVAKKIVDVIDDLWRVITKPLKMWIPTELVNAITPFLIGSTNLIIHFCEGVEGFYSAIKAIRKKKTIARTTKIITGFIIAAIGATGTGLAASYIASATGAAVLGAQFMPVLIPALLTCIFIVGLSKNIDILKTVNKLYKNEQTQLKLLREYARKIDHTKSTLIDNLEKQKAQLIAERNRLVFNLTSRDNVDAATQLTIRSIESKITAITKEQNFHSFEIDEAYKAVDKQKEQIEKFRQKKLAAEREVAFKAIELTASIIVLTGTILGTAAILGAASVATLGFLPLGLVIAGVVIAGAFKFFEYLDGKKDHKFTNGMRNFFTDKVGPLFGFKKKFEATVDERYHPEKAQPLVKPVSYKRSSSTANLFDDLDVRQKPINTTTAPITGKAKPVAALVAKSVPAASPIQCNDFKFTTPSDGLALSRSRN